MTLSVALAASCSDDEDATGSGNSGGSTQAAGGAGPTTGGAGPTTTTSAAGGAGGTPFTGPGTCADPIPISVGDTMVMADSAGAPNEHDATCALAFADVTGPELVFTFTPDFDGTVEVTADGSAAAFDLAVSIRKACDDTGASACCAPTGAAGCAADGDIETCVCAIDSYCCDTDWDGVCAAIAGDECTDTCAEIACADIEIEDTAEVTGAQVANGTPYFIHVDGFDGASGAFSLSLTQVPNETVCDDLEDQDYDDLYDCKDPSDCTCTPGAGVVGSACTANGDCASVADNDPLCLSEALFGETAGYCSEWCDLGTDDCPAGSICASLSLPPFGACLETCAMDTDCARNGEGYTCQDIGLASMVCLTP